MKFAREVARGESITEQRRAQLCKLEGFRPPEVFRALTRLAAEAGLPDRISVASLQQWLKREGGPSLDVQLDETSRICLRSAHAPRSGGEVNYSEFLRLVIPRDQVHTELKQAALYAGPADAGVPGGGGCYTLPPAVAQALRRLLEEEVELLRRLSAASRELTEYCALDEVFSLLAGLPGASGAVTLCSARTLLAEQLGGLTPEEVELFFRRLEPGPLGSASFDGLAALASPLDVRRRGREMGQHAKDRSLTAPATGEPLDARTCLGGLLELLAERGDKDVAIEEAKAELRACVPPHVNAAEACFKVLDRGGKGYITDTDVWQLLSDERRPVAMADAQALVHELVMDRLPEAGTAPGGRPAFACTRLTLRDVCALVFPRLSAEMRAVRHARDDQDALSELYLMSRTSACPNCKARLQRSAETMCGFSAACVFCGTPLCCAPMAGDREVAALSALGSSFPDTLQLTPDAKVRLFTVLELVSAAAADNLRRRSQLARSPAWVGNPTKAATQALWLVADSSGAIWKQDLRSTLVNHGLWSCQEAEQHIWHRAASLYNLPSTNTVPLDSLCRLVLPDSLWWREER